VSEPTSEQPHNVAANSGATSSERAQAQAVHELSAPERLDGSERAEAPDAGPER
jgi:hypothetical protein